MTADQALDHYSTLGVSKTATPEEIRKAYKRKASSEHPDKGGSKEGFQMISRAHSVLMDPKRRAAYDAGADDAPVDPDSALLNELVGAFLAVVESVEDPEHTDVVAEVKRRIDKRLEKANNELITFRQHVDKIERVRKRIKRKKKEGSNFFSAALDSVVKNSRLKIAAAEEEAAKMKRMYVLLAEYRYEAEIWVPLTSRWTTGVLR